MDAIKKKMQAMKIEKENALDKAEQLDQKLRDIEESKAKVRFYFFFCLCFIYKKLQVLRFSRCLRLTMLTNEYQFHTIFLPVKYERCDWHRLKNIHLFSMY